MKNPQGGGCLRTSICILVSIALATGSFAQTLDQSLESILRAYRSGDYQGSVPRLKSLAAAGNREAQAMVCEATLLGRGTAKRLEPYEKCQEAADAGVPLAQGLVAQYRLLGAPGFLRDLVQASAWAQKGAHRDDPRSVRVLGDMHFYGLGAERSDQQAQRYYERATRLGDIRAHSMLAAIYAGRTGRVPDYANAINHARVAANAGDAVGQSQLGLLFQYGGGDVAKNTAEAAKWYTAAANQGLPEAQYGLGVLLLDGDGVQKNEAEAATWFRRAADQGHANSQSELGALYFLGQGLPKDYVQAANWYRKAAEQGFALAQTYLASMYANGHGVPKDDVQAVSWFRKAAEQGNAEAQTYLGVMYANGRGVARDDVQAVNWFRKAADQGLAVAQLNLGKMYSNTRVPRDEAWAVGWYRKAAEQGNAEAQHNLGVVYAFGRGVPQNDAVALHWVRKAAEQGYAPSQRVVESYNKQEKTRAERPLTAGEWLAIGAVAVIGLSILTSGDETGAASKDQTDPSEARYRACVREKERCLSNCRQGWAPNQDALRGCEAGCPTLCFR